MKIFIAMLIAVCANASVIAAQPQAVPVDLPLALKAAGSRHHGSSDPGTALFQLTFGDTGPANDRVTSRLEAGLYPYGLDWAMFLPNADGTWKVFQVRMPRPEEQEALMRFFDQHSDVVQDPFAHADFGEPGDFIYRRMKVPQSSLPSPLGRVSRDAVTPIESVFRHNSDGTIDVHLKKGFDENGRAQEVFERLKKEIERSAPGR